jgi:membrane-bound metal-dependent hydrolase YbcI (DUF457 family)
MGLGALIPDLDREYWYVRPTKLVDEQKEYADEQVHRARFHNVFMLPLTYLASPFLSAGVFLHMLQDSFTTAKDRGVEWFYPLTRLVRRGLKDAAGNPVPTDPKEQVYFYQEDPKGLVNNADPDLRELGPDPVPWRRVYGFAQNSHLLDRGFLAGSIAILFVWLLWPLGTSNAASLLSGFESDWVFVGYLAVVVLYIAGETDRRDIPAKLPSLRPVRWPLLGLGMILLVVWFGLYGPRIAQNLGIIFSDPGLVASDAVAVVLAVTGMVLWRRSLERKKKIPSVV